MPTTDVTENATETDADDGGIGPRARSRRNPWSSSSRPPRPRPSPVCSAPATSSSPRSVTSATCPAGRDEVPAAYKGESWSRLGVDVDNGFKPLYVVSSDKKSQVAKLKQLVKQASEVYLASDEDREGESIAWHLLEVLAPAGAGQADGLPRDHQAGHRARGPGVARPRPATRRRPGGPADPRPALRLRGVAGALEEDHAAALGRAGPERGDPDGGRAGALADGLPLGELVGDRGDLPLRRARCQRASPVPSPPRWSRSTGRTLASGRDFDSTGHLSASEPVVVLDEAEARSLADRAGRGALHGSRR